MQLSHYLNDDGQPFPQTSRETRVFKMDPAEPPPREVVHNEKACDVASKGCDPFLLRSFRSLCNPTLTLTRKEILGQLTMSCVQLVLLVAVLPNSALLDVLS